MSFTIRKPMAPVRIPLETLVAFLKPLRWQGDPKSVLTNITSINAGAKDTSTLVWCGDSSTSLLKQNVIATVICGPSTESTCAERNLPHLVVENPRLAFTRVLAEFFVEPKPPPSISPKAVIHPSAVVAQSATIGAHAVIEAECNIGERTIIGPGVVLQRRTIIGNDCVIGANTVIGGVGFGYERDDVGDAHAIPHIGSVRIGNRVEIGACTAIDRAVLGETVIEDGVKIDNLVHIAHGCSVGEGSFVIAHAMLGGSVTVGKRAWIAPTAAIIQKVPIGDDAVVGLGAVVLRPVEKSSTVVGNPARPLHKKQG